MKGGSVLLTIALFGSMAAAGQSGRRAMSGSEHPFPDFSWDRVPVVAHFGKHGDLLTRDERKFLARHFPLVVLEKAHGFRTQGSTEAGIAADAAQLKRLARRMKVIFYWNAFIDYGNLYRASDTFQRHPEWAMKDLQGNVVTVQAAKRRRYDQSNPGLRRWWVDVAAEACSNPAIDGVFIDALPQLSMHPKANEDIWGQEKQRSLEEGMNSSLRMLRDRVGPGKMLLYNGLRGRKELWADMGMRYYDVCDAAMIEHFGALQGASKEVMANDMEAIREAGRLGKAVIVKGWPGFTWLDTEMMKKPYTELEQLSRERITFPLAAFLAAAGERAYFCYTWGYREDHGTFSWYPEFDRRLGPPLGDAIREGWTYTREFEHARVWVDLEKREGRITWR